MDSITYNHETVVARRNSMLIVGVYLLRIQILVVGGYPAPTQWVCRLGGPGAVRCLKSGTGSGIQYHNFRL
jgi:hypothetical protein